MSDEFTDLHILREDIANIVYQAKSLGQVRVANPVHL